MNNCTEYLDRISALIDGELTPEEEQALRVHISACDSCRCYYEVLRDLSNAMGKLEEPPEQLKLGVMKKLPSVVAQPKVRRMPRYGWKHYMALAACLAVLLLGGKSLGNLTGGDKNGAALFSLPYATVADVPRVEIAETTTEEPPSPEPAEAEQETELKATMYNGMVDADLAAGSEISPETPMEAAEPYETSEPREATEEEGIGTVDGVWLYACLLKNDAAAGEMTDPNVFALLEKMLSDKDAAQADVPEREADYVLQLETGDDAYGDAFLLWIENETLLCYLHGSDGPCFVLPIIPEEFLSLFS